MAGIRAGPHEFAVGATPVGRWISLVLWCSLEWLPGLIYPETGGGLSGMLAYHEANDGQAPR